MSAAPAVQFAPDFLEKVTVKARAAARKVIVKEVAKETSRQFRKVLEARLENALAEIEGVDPVALFAAAEAEAADVIAKLTELAMIPQDSIPASASPRGDTAPLQAQAPAPYTVRSDVAPAPFWPVVAPDIHMASAPAPVPTHGGDQARFEPSTQPGSGMPAFPRDFVPAQFAPLVTLKNGPATA